MALFYPRFTGLLFLYVLAGWALLSGSIEILAAWRLRRETRGESWIGIAGVISLLFGILLVSWPGAGALTVVWLIASYSVLLGVVLIVWGLYLRRLPLSDRQRITLRVAAIGGGHARRGDPQ